MDMSLSEFYDFYTSKYFSIPIYTLIDMIILVDVEFQNYVKEVYCD